MSTTTPPTLDAAQRDALLVLVIRQLRSMGDLGYSIEDSLWGVVNDEEPEENRDLAKDEANVRDKTLDDVGALCEKLFGVANGRQFIDSSTQGATLVSFANEFEKTLPAETLKAIDETFGFEEEEETED